MSQERPAVRPKGEIVKSTTMKVGAPVVIFLEDRGARPFRSGGTFNPTQVLHRAVEMLKAVLKHSDPRLKMSEELMAAAFEVLDTPWNLRARDIEHLEDFVQRRPGFEKLGPQLQADLVSAVGTLTFAERASLVDLATLHHAPTAAKREVDAPWTWPGGLNLEV